MGLLPSSNKLQAIISILFLPPVLLVPCSYSKSCPDSDEPPPSLGKFNYDSTLDTKSQCTIANDSGLFANISWQELADMSDAGAGERPSMYVIPGSTSSVRLITYNEACVLGASFNVSFTMSLYPPSWNETTAGQSNTSSIRGVAFLAMPDIANVFRANETLTKLLALGARGSLILSNPRSWTAPIAGAGSVSGDLGWLPSDASLPLDDPPSRHLVIRITGIRQPAEERYTVWIEYDGRRRILAVYIGAGGKSKGRPEKAVVTLDQVRYRDPVHRTACFGLFSSLGQLKQVHTWSTEGDELPDSEYFILQNIARLKRARRQRLRMTVGSVAGSVSAAAAVAVAAAFYFRSKQRRWKKEQEKLTRIMQRLPGVPTQVDFADIRKATAGFHETTRLGTGGFSSVYRCRLPAASTSSSSTAEVAVKKFTRGVHEERYEDFLAEVSIINRLRHKNVVPLVGWSYHKGEPLLIYEYMKNGSLDQHLFRRGGDGEQRHQQEETSIRQWHTRYSIVRDIATGLHYVHHEHEPMVLHRDIKASNIMLDSNFHARVGDFGIACTVAADRSSATGMVGTWGYIAPDYAMSHRATRQTDIYAFGVLVLEIVTGKKNMDVPTEDGHISGWVWRLHGEGQLLEAVDGVVLTQSRMNPEEIAGQAKRLLLLGLACTNPNPSSRPSMAEAVQVITKLAPPPEVPLERPKFVWPPEPEEWRSLDDSDNSTTVMSNFGASFASTVEISTPRAEAFQGSCAIRAEGRQQLPHESP